MALTLFELVHLVSKSHSLSKKCDKNGQRGSRARLCSKIIMHTKQHDAAFLWFAVNTTCFRLCSSAFFSAMSRLRSFLEVLWLISGGCCRSSSSSRYPTSSTSDPSRNSSALFTLASPSTPSKCVIVLCKLASSQAAKYLVELAATFAWLLDQAFRVDGRIILATTLRLWRSRMFLPVCRRIRNLIGCPVHKIF